MSVTFTPEVPTATRVRVWMALKGWSLEDLATHAGLTKQAWHKALRRDDMLASHIVRLANAFGVTPNDLIPTVQPCDEDEDKEWMNAPMGKMPEYRGPNVPETIEDLTDFMGRG